MRVKQISGNYNLKIPKFLEFVQTNKLYLECLTGSGPVTISLPQISTLPAYATTWGWHLYISDFDRNAAANNITIISAVGDIISGAAATIVNVNGGVAEVFVAGSNIWGGLLGPAGGGGSGGILKAIYFKTIAAQNNYVFDGTITAWNPTGIDLRTKQSSFYSSGGIIQNPTATPTIQYVWTPATGNLHLEGTIYNNVTGGLFYQT